MVRPHPFSDHYHLLMKKYFSADPSRNQKFGALLGVLSFLVTMVSLIISSTSSVAGMRPVGILTGGLIIGLIGAFFSLRYDWTTNKRQFYSRLATIGFILLMLSTYMLFFQPPGL